MAKIKPQALLLQSKKKKGPSRISYATIGIYGLIVVVMTFFLFASYRHWTRRSFSFSFNHLVIYFSRCYCMVLIWKLDYSLGNVCAIFLYWISRTISAWISWNYIDLRWIWRHSGENYQGLFLGLGLDSFRASALWKYIILWYFSSSLHYAINVLWLLNYRYCLAFNFVVLIVAEMIILLFITFISLISTRSKFQEDISSAEEVRFPWNDFCRNYYLFRILHFSMSY